MFGQELRQNILAHLMDRAYGQALEEKSLQAVSMPSFALIPDGKAKMLTFSATFEIMPEIKLPAFKKLKVTRQVTSIDDVAVTSMLDKFRTQHGEWHAVERAAQMGDQVNLDYVGKLKGEPFEGGTAQDAELELGTGQFIEGFEEGLVDASIGDAMTLNLTFPKPYHSEALAGQKVTFDVKINGIKARELPELNEAFIQKLGIESGKLEDLQSELRSTMEREAEKASQQQVKSAVFKSLEEAASFDLPKALIDQEVHQMQQDMQQRFLSSGGTQDQLPDLPKTLFEAQATQRVKIGLLVAEVIKQHEIKVDQTRVDETIAKLAQQYQDAKEVIQWYNENDKERQKLASVVLEDQVVDLILDQAKVSEESVAYEALINPDKQ